MRKIYQKNYEKNLSVTLRDSPLLMRNKSHWTDGRVAGNNCQHFGGRN